MLSKNSTTDQCSCLFPALSDTTFGPELVLGNPQLVLRKHILVLTVMASDRSNYNIHTKPHSSMSAMATRMYSLLVNYQVLYELPERQSLEWGCPYPISDPSMCVSKCPPRPLLCDGLPPHTHQTLLQGR